MVVIKVSTHLWRLVPSVARWFSFQPPGSPWRDKSTITKTGTTSVDLSTTITQVQSNMDSPLLMSGSRWQWSRVWLLQWHTPPEPQEVNSSCKGKYIHYLEQAAFGREGVRAAIVLRPAKEQGLCLKPFWFSQTNLLRNMLELQKWFKSEKVGKIISWLCSCFKCTISYLHYINACLNEWCTTTHNNISTGSTVALAIRTSSHHSYFQELQIGTGQNWIDGWVAFLDRLGFDQSSKPA